MPALPQQQSTLRSTDTQQSLPSLPMSQSVTGSLNSAQLQKLQVKQAILGSSQGVVEGGDVPTGLTTRRGVRHTPSRLSLLSQPQRISVDLLESSRPSFDGRMSHSARGPLSFSVTSQPLAPLHKAMERLMMTDSDMYRKVQSSMQGISSLAKETNNLQLGRDATGATMINQYVVVKTLGRGSFGKVKLCLNTLDGQLYAVKMVNRAFILRTLQKPARGLRRRVPQRNTSETEMKERVAPSLPNSSSSIQDVSSYSFSSPSRPSLDEPLPSHSQSTGVNNPMDGVMREIAVLKKLDHPNVVKLFEVIDPPGSQYMMLVMEYMEKGAVMETKGQSGFSTFPEAVALDYFRQVCAGLDYLHYNCVVHGDLKPENLLLTASGQIKIGDFGSSRVISDKHASSKVSCTPAFQPPEAILAGSTAREDPFAADVWALGVCLYCFVFGRLPFVGSCVLDISNAIVQETVKYSPAVHISRELRDLFGAIFQKEPAKRITLKGIMEHPWTTNYGCAPLVCLKALNAPPPSIEVTKKEAMDAIDRTSLVSMIRARLKEKMFVPGEYLFREGDEAHCIFMIMSGVVEIVSKVPVGAVSELDSMEDQSFSVDMDESFTLDCTGLAPPQVLPLKDGKLHIDRIKAQELKKRMSMLLLGQGREYVVEVKGPGQVIGEVALDKAAAAHKVSARAKDHVTAVKLTEENFVKALLQMYGAEEMSALSSETASLMVLQNLEDAGTEYMDSGVSVPISMPISMQGMPQTQLHTIEDVHDDPLMHNLE